MSKQMADKARGLTYESGMHMMQEEKEEKVEEGAKKGKKGQSLCRFCRLFGHSTKRSADCKFYKSSDKEADADAVSKFVLTATQNAVGDATTAGTNESSEVQSKGECEYFCICCDTDNIKLTGTAAAYNSHSENTQESENEASESESVGYESSPDELDEPVGDAISTIRAEISELDTMAFDEDIVPMETVDI
jgi:hypothetical protein